MGFTQDGDLDLVGYPDDGQPCRRCGAVHMIEATDVCRMLHDHPYGHGFRYHVTTGCRCDVCVHGCEQVKLDAQRQRQRKAAGKNTQPGVAA